MIVEGQKTCGGCKEEKALSFFNLSTTGKMGRHNHCRVCQKATRRRYYLQNRVKEIAKTKVYFHTAVAAKARAWTYSKNKEIILARNRKRRATPEVREKTNSCRLKRYREDTNFRLAVNLRHRIRKAMKGIIKKESSVSFLGCSIGEFKKYIEDLFKPGMTWENYTYRGWHIDHKRPCISFDLSDDKQRAECFHYTNLQPLWMAENISKHGRMGAV